MARDESVRHGIRYTYRVRKCRCDECVEWNRERLRKEREANPGRNAQYQAKFRERNPGAGLEKRQLFARSKAEETRTVAIRAGQEWTGPEMELVSRDDLTVTEIAKMLGRTYAAVTYRRHALKVDPRAVALAGNAPDPTPGTVALSGELVTRT